jgi:hypothetical protein
MIILPDTHLDHGITPAQRDWLFAELGARELSGFQIMTLQLPEGLGTVPCGLYGPSMGDPPVEAAQTHQLARGARKWPSRLMVAPKRPTRQVTVIAGPSGEHPMVLYTAYGGAAAPREPGDTSLEGDPEGLAEAVAFWAAHALAVDEVGS